MHEVFQQLIRILSKDFDAKIHKTVEALLFVDIRRISGPNPNPSLLVLAAFQTFIIFYLSEGLEAEYLKIFEAS